MKTKLIKKQCLVCNKEFATYPSHNKKYCSAKCYAVFTSKNKIGFYKKGHPNYNHKTTFKNGSIPWNKGKTHKEDLRILNGEKSGAWKGGLSSNKNYVYWSKNKRNRFLHEMRRINGSHLFSEWELLKKQYGYTCPSCGKKEPEIKLTEDHIIPISRGGSDFIENIQPLCGRCNSSKYTKIIKY